jgi:hypothetical protein
LSLGREDQELVANGIKMVSQVDPQLGQDAQLRPTVMRVGSISLMHD